MMNRDVADHRARFAVVVLSSGIQVTPNTEFRKDFRRKLGVEDLFYPERRIAALGEERGFPVLQLSPKLQSEAVATGVHFHGFDDSLGTGHWNRSGHRRAGELLGEWLCQVMESGENRVIPSVETHEGPFRRGQEERIARQRADP